MKVTGVPAQIVSFGVTEITIAGVIAGLTVIVMAGLVTGAVDAHAALLVIVTVTISPVDNVVVVYVGLLVPTIVVPIFH